MKFSVLLSIYEKENPEYLNQALSSIWNEQTRKPDQIVLVEDGPLTSELNNTILQWKENLGSVLDIVYLPKNLGLGAALNEGLKVCKWDIVARMDADDIALPRRFEKQIDFLEQNADVSIVGTYCSFIDYSGKEIGTRTVPIDHDSIVNKMWSCPLVHPSVMYNKNNILNIGGYNEDLKRRQDYELWFRCACKGLLFANIPEYLLKYRVLVASYKKNGVRFAWKQAIIGYRGSCNLNLGYLAKVAVFFPFVKVVLPDFLVYMLDKVFKRFDPRK